ncbi:MAG TPA: histidine--tRNA ligase [candidate division Zixibacteria bacterium]|nr:histidine--tRNA ligase [candidate division Zixibacteria bacterium]
MKVSAIKGFSDVLPGDVETWQVVEEQARKMFAAYNFSEIRIPILEKTELFTRSIGETTDIVEKEMYTFADRDAKGSLLTLRPEGTAGVVRAYVENELYKTEPVRKLFYVGPMFRRERPQKGRMRQFHQIGAEALGRSDPFIDAELLLLLNDFFAAVGVGGASLQLNSLGCVRCRPPYREALQKYLREREAQLCFNCRQRIERNPLRVLDCKEPGCTEKTRNAPSILEHLCEACREHLEAVQRLLGAADVAFALNPRMVRGLDYYCRTAFEWISDQLGAQNAIAAGGRYDGLVHDLGGPSIPGVGFAIGVERLVLLLKLKGPHGPRGPALYVVAIGRRAREWVFPLVRSLRRQGLTVEMDGEEKSLKSQMRRADKLKAETVLIVGDDELARGRLIVRDMRKQRQEEIAAERAEAELLARKAGG